MARHPDYRYTVYPWNEPPDWDPDAPGYWKPSTIYAVGDYCQPITTNNFVYIVTTAGVSHTSEPSWVSSGNINDNTVVWVKYGDLIEWKMGYWYEPTTSLSEYITLFTLISGTKEKNKTIALKKLTEVKVELSEFSRFRQLKKYRNPYSNKDFLGSWRGLTVEAAATDIFHKITSKDKNRLDIVSYQYYDTIELWWVICLANRNVISNPLNVPVNTILRIPDLARIHREVLE